jgi:X-X-X-Leu-X-X-Gly heptad repeat protein
LNSGNTTLPGPKTYNALDLASSSTNLDISGGGILTLTSGGILETGNGITDTLSVPRIALLNNLPAVNSTAAVEGVFQIATGATLDITGSIVAGGSGFTKGLGGNLIFSNTQFITGGTDTLNGGVTQLNGGTNTLDTNIALNVNYGATLDLNGNTQWTGAFGSGSGAGTSSNGVNLSGGTVTSTNGAALLVANTGGTWAGSITGNGANNVVSFAAPRSRYRTAARFRTRPRFISITRS